MNGPAALLVWLVTSPPAHAVSTCNAGAGDGVSGLVVFGLVYGTTHLGVCEYTSAGGGTWTLTEIAACDTSDASTSNVYLYDDVVNASTKIGPVTRSSGIDCNGTQLMPFAASFAFGLTFDGKTGSDTVYGTAHSDYLRSNVGLVTTTDNNTYYEYLCGYDGNDVLTSHNFAASTGVGTCLNGGLGGGIGTTAECTVNSLRQIDAVYDCNTVANAPGLSVNCDDCDCGSAPDDSFFPEP